MKYIFSLEGKLVSGKNQQGIAMRAGGGFRRYPNANFVRWRNTMSKQIWQQRSQIGISALFIGPVHLSVDYYPGDRIKRDATGMLDAIFHLLEHTNILEDDSQVLKINWVQWPIDTARPRCVLVLYDLENS